MNQSKSMINRHELIAESKPDGNSLWSVNRRGFLVGAAIGATSVAAAGAAPHANPAGTNSEIPVGYWHQSDERVLAGCSASEQASERVCSARTISPDPMPLNGSARLTIYGLFGAELCSDMAKVEIIGHHFINDAIGSVPVHLWSHSAGATLNRSASVRCIVPVGHNGGVRLALVAHSKTRTAGSNSAPIAASHDCSLISAYQPGAAGLRAGVYFIALRDIGRAGWGSCVYMLNNGADGHRKLFRRSLSVMKEVDFPYLVCSVSPAESSHIVRI